MNGGRTHHGAQPGQGQEHPGINRRIGDSGGPHRHRVVQREPQAGGRIDDPHRPESIKVEVQDNKSGNILCTLITLI